MAGGAPKKTASQKKSAQRTPFDSKHGSKNAEKGMQKAAGKKGRK